MQFLKEFREQICFASLRSLLVFTIIGQVSISSIVRFHKISQWFVKIRIIACCSKIFTSSDLWKSILQNNLTHFSVSMFYTNLVGNKSSPHDAHVETNCWANMKWRQAVEKREWKQKAGWLWTVGSCLWIKIWFLWIVCCLKFSEVAEVI